MRYALVTYKYLFLLCILNIVMQMVSDVTAGRIMTVYGLAVSVTVIYFPLTYIFSDIITEVYGFKAARQVLYLTLSSSILAGLAYQLAIIMPAGEAFQTNSRAYEDVLGRVPLILIAGWLAVFTGDILNNYVLAKMKIITKGKYLWARLIVSTMVGQFANTSIFYLIAFTFELPMSIVLKGILAASIIKIGVEILMSPITYIVVQRLKRLENVDHYDHKTDFNLFNFANKKRQKY